MAEQHLENVQLTEHQLVVATGVADTALDIVGKRYGTGYPNFTEGSEANLAYHNTHHSYAVARDAVRLARALGCSVAEVATADGAGSSHDIKQLAARGLMEAESAEWYAQQIRARGLPEAMAQAGALAILGTEPIFEGNVLVGQRATQLAYPSKSAERVGLSVACGDFGELYTPFGPYQSHKLYQEIKGVGPHEPLPLEGLVQFEAGQVALRERYRYPLAGANDILATHRSEVMAYGEETLRLLEAGSIETWAELEARDLAFWRQHS